MSSSTNSNPNHNLRTLNDLQSDLTQMKEEGHINKELLDWLAGEGYIISDSTLRRRLRAWGVRRKTAVSITDELAERVNWLFHHTLLNDSQIASRIVEENNL